jgi:predicted ATPase
VTPFKMSIEYPITAIAGKNGAGKSTLIAIACCAFHNQKSGFKLARRKNSYYTFSDFFIQHTAEKSPDGVSIQYFFAVDTMADKSKYPDGKAIAFQRRWKSLGGKWNDYDQRLKKTVVFLGIERIVPHNERSQSRSYSKVFSSIKAQAWEEKVKDVVGSILAKKYDEFRLLTYSKYSLPLVRVGTTVYSGFNMGAGENALFEIFSAIYACGGGALIVLDEIELGLHAEAQKRFMASLKSTCLETHTQVLCTTHSREIFDSLPDDARFFVEQVNGKTRITAGISSDFAMAKMGARQEKELQIFVEDDIAQSVVTSALPAGVRTRVDVVRIGSATAMARQLAAAYVRGEKRPLLAVFDGDQVGLEGDNVKHAKAMAETTKSDVDHWIKSRLAYLPGGTWPEAWLIQVAQGVIPAVAAAVGAGEDEMAMFLEYGLQAGKHNEFYEIAKHIGWSRSQTVDVLVPVICGAASAELEALRVRVSDLLG